MVVWQKLRDSRESSEQGATRKWKPRGSRNHEVEWENREEVGQMMPEVREWRKSGVLVAGVRMSRDSGQ